MKSWVISISGTFRDQILVSASSEAEAREKAMGVWDESYFITDVTNNNEYEWDKLEITDASEGVLF